MTDTSQTLTNKIALVTGATAGIGLAAAAQLAERGAWVVGVGRNPERCARAEAQLRASYPTARVDFLVADLSEQAQVRQLAAQIHALLPGRLDILVNNAGVFSETLTRTTDGIEMTLAVNHLAPFLLTHHLYPLLLAAAMPRVISVSSASHYNTWLDVERINTPLLYQGLWAYKLSKLENVLFSMELNRRAAGAALRAFAVDPGLINTEIGQKNSPGISGLVWRIRRRGGKPPEVPARTITFLAQEVSLQNAKDYYYRDSKPRLPSRAALNPDLAARLWQKSCDLCHIRPESWGQPEPLT